MRSRHDLIRHSVLAAFVLVWALTVLLRVVGLDHPAPIRVFVDRWGQEGAPTVRGFLSSEAREATSLQIGDRLLRVGGIDLEGRGQLRFLAALSEAAWQAEGPIEFVVERDGLEIPVLEDPPRAPRPGYIAGIVSAVVWLVVAFLIGLRAEPTLNNRMLFLFMASYGLTNIYALDGPAWVFWYSVALKAVCLTSMPFILLGLLGIPREAGSLKGVNLYWPWLFLPINASQHAQQLGFPLDPGVGETLTSITFPVFILTAMAVLAVNFRRSGPIGRRQVKWVLMGMYLGSLLGLLNMARFGWEPLNPTFEWVALDLAANLCFPIALFIGVSRFDLLDVDRLLGATVAYNVLGVAVIGIGLVTLPPLTEFLADSLAIDPSVGRVGITLAVAGMVVLAQRRLSPQVDRLIFKERYALDQAMKDAPEKLAVARVPEELWETVGHELVENVRPGSCVIYTRGSQTYLPAFVTGEVMPPHVPGAGTLVEWVAGRESATLIQRQDLKGIGTLGRAVFSSLATLVLIPVHRGTELEAFISMGEKRSGDIYTGTDLTLLTTLAKALSVHLLRFTDAERLEQSRAIQEKMRRYVPGALAQEIELGRDLETGEREVSVLFVDIRGFTAYSETREAPEIFAAINRYTETCSTIVHECGGAVVEFNGDGMMAVFGAPRRLANKEQAAVEAARRMIKDVPDTAQGEPLSVGVGVATGTAFVGNIEAVDRTIWSALGRPVNLAARLQALTREMEASILVDKTTHQRAGSAVEGFAVRPGVSIRGRMGEEILYSLGTASASG